MRSKLLAAAVSITVALLVSPAAADDSHQSRSQTRVQGATLTIKKGEVISLPRIDTSGQCDDPGVAPLPNYCTAEVAAAGPAAERLLELLT